MRFAMADGTEPYHAKRFGIIRMVTMKAAPITAGIALRCFRNESSLDGISKRYSCLNSDRIGHRGVIQQAFGFSAPIRIARVESLSFSISRFVLSKPFTPLAFSCSCTGTILSLPASRLLAMFDWIFIRHDAPLWHRP
jgi:hypothetical protein